MDYNFKLIERKWQDYWRKNKVFEVKENKDKKKFYILDMFPYPSGSGLHVGHPLGYIASDILARYKSMLGYNVLHPMGYDSFGLPAEQYAIETGQHPSITTEINKKTYRKQLDNIGFAFNWEREISTSDPKYYRWTQWIFKQLFNSFYCKTKDKAMPISYLIAYFEKQGNKNSQAVCDEKTPQFLAADWSNFSKKERENILQHYRLAFLSDTWVNWCEGLGTVLANDEIKDGLSERGGYPVEQKMMRQWMMRITAYADRLLSGLKKIEWNDSIKEVQKNWIGKSNGVIVSFNINNNNIDVFTTRPDTIFGVTFLVLSPEHDIINKIVTKEQKKIVNEYIKKTSLKTERDRKSNIKDITGEFTGAYALHPFTKEKIPVWISDYVLSSYGTGAIMAVPCGDQRDWDFANHFKIKIINIFKDIDISNNAYDGIEAKITNSDFLNNKYIDKAILESIRVMESKNIGKFQINYKLRDAVFSRQRYWGEPFPVYYKNNIPYIIESDKVVELPSISKYLPTKKGEPPLARVKKSDWKAFYGDRMEYNTMPGWAGSSWYFIRYMDPNNKDEFVSQKKLNYWKQVDLYIGGAEHAVGHLLYSRFWTKFLFDKGFIPFDEPFKKMINQGMILGRSSIVYRIKGTNKFVSYEKHKEHETIKINVDINIINNDILNIELFKKWRTEFKNAEFILNNNNEYRCGAEIEKMSKSKFNTQSPDDLIKKYGADSLRLYEMFLGPITQSKPWNKNGISGCYNFLKKYWNLLHKQGDFFVEDKKMNLDELKIIHNTIKKVKNDIELYSFNTAISSLMICLNYMSNNNIIKVDMIKMFNLILYPFAPHITEEIWSKLNYTESITFSNFPSYNEKYMSEKKYDYPISFNGKVKFKIELSTSLKVDKIKDIVLSHDKTIKQLSKFKIKKVIIIPGKIVNIVF